MASSEQPEHFVADPEGDVRFIIGNSEFTKVLRVSSKVLSLASPVFKALFSPKFSEGTALSISQAVPEIRLPDDDPEAMQLILHILHHGKNAPGILRIELLEKVAVLCDKYDIVKIFAAWSDLWLQGRIESATDEDEWVRIMGVSSVFGNHKKFHLASTKSISACSIMNSVTLDKDFSVVGRLPDDLFGKLLPIPGRSIDS